MDEGSYEPDPTLKKIRSVSEEALEAAHKHGLVRTTKEALQKQKEEDEKEDD